MAETPETVEQQVEQIIRASFAHESIESEDSSTAHEQSEEQRVIDVDLYRLSGGAVLLVPNSGTNPLDATSVESVAPITEEDEAAPQAETPTLPLVQEEEDQQEVAPQAPEPVQEPVALKTQSKASVLLAPLVLLALLALGLVSVCLLLPLLATASVTITPKAKSLHTTTTLTIATKPQAGQVQGRALAESSLTKSITVPATGHAHDDARAATGAIVFYNTDLTPVSIPAGITFSVNGLVVVTETAVMLPAAVPPIESQAVTPAHVLEAGAAGNLPARAISTHCCQAAILATNLTPFRGGQDARSYSYVQSSDIQNAATTLIAGLTPQATALLHQQLHAGENLVTPLCTPQTTSSQQPGTETVAVSVAVTQTCRSVAYSQDSLQQVATSFLAHRLTMSTYEQVDTTQVTITGSIYGKQGASLNVSLSGVWVYRLTQARLIQLTHQIAGASQQEAKAILAKGDGVAQVSIHLHRLDWQDRLPTDPEHITMQVFYLVS